MVGSQWDDGGTVIGVRCCGEEALSDTSEGDAGRLWAGV